LSVAESVDLSILYVARFSWNVASVAVRLFDFGGARMSVTVSTSVVGCVVRWPYAGAVCGAVVVVSIRARWWSSSVLYVPVRKEPSCKNILNEGPSPSPPYLRRTSFIRYDYDGTTYDVDYIV
jgi:hypothetical protein